MSYYFAKIVNAPFADVVARAKAALAERGFGILSEIDVAQTLKAKVGANLAPYVILGACNPHHASRALQVEDKIGVMLPCNVIVRQASAGSVEVAAVDPVKSMQAVQNPTLAEVAATVQTLLRQAVDAI